MENSHLCHGVCFHFLKSLLRSSGVLEILGGLHIVSNSCFGCYIHVVFSYIIYGVMYVKADVSVLIHLLFF